MILMSLQSVQPGMVVGVGLRNREGHVLLGPGVALTSSYIERLHELGYCALWIDDADTRDIAVEDTLSEQTRLAATAAIQDTFMMTSREVTKLRGTSVGEVRGAIETRRFQQAFQDADVIHRLTGQVDTIVEEVLGRAVLTGLSSLRTHNSYVYQHCLDVAITAVTIARMVGCEHEMLKKLTVGCLLHDIGVIFLKSAVFDKPGALNAEELAQMKEHPVLGYLFVRDTLKLGSIASHIAYQHHERQDGGGYPRGLRGGNRIAQGVEVHMPGRIMPMAEVATIADFYDGCSADRPYRPRVPADRAWQMIHAAAGTQLNREIVERFLEVLPPYPIGTQVAVRDGRWAGHTGVVVRFAPHAMHTPHIRLLADTAGERIAPIDVDTAKEPMRLEGIVGSTAGPEAEPAPEEPVATF